MRRGSCRLAIQKVFEGEIRRGDRSKSRKDLLIDILIGIPGQAYSDSSLAMNGFDLGSGDDTASYFPVDQRYGKEDAELAALCVSEDAFYEFRLRRLDQHYRAIIPDLWISQVSTLTKHFIYHTFLIVQPRTP